MSTGYVRSWPLAAVTLDRVSTAASEGAADQADITSPMQQPGKMVEVVRAT